MAPALRIPITLDMQAFQRQTGEIGNHVNGFLKQVAQRVDATNTQIVSSTVGAATRMVAAFTLAAVGAKLLQDAINATRADLEKMVAVADKAANSNVSPVFFQSFVSEAEKLKVSADELEGALGRAFEATREKSPINLSEWETGKEKITEVEKALRVFNTSVVELEGLVLFRDAQNQEQKIQAVLTAMKELEEAGKRAESLQLGELMFGQKFIDNIRLGKTSIDSILSSMKAATEAGSSLFSDEMVKRAKDVDDQLKLAHQRLDKELRPQWNGLARTMLEIKGYWADVVALIASAARLVNQFDLGVKRDELSRVNRAIDTGESLIPGVPRVPETVRFALGKTTPIQDELVARKAKLEEEIAELEGRLRTRVTVTSGSRGAGAVPTKLDPGEAHTRFDSAINTAEKRAAALQAEADNIDKTTAARERAKLVAELETVAVQANTAAGLENTAVTTAQREEIDRVAAAYEQAAAKLEVMRGPLASFLRDGRDLNKGLQEVVVGGLRGLEDALISVANRTKTMAEAFREMASSIIADIGRVLIRAAIARAAGVVFSSFGGGATSGFAGSAVGAGGGNTLSFGGPRAGGGPVSGGVAYQIGERGPEIFVPNSAGTIVPNDVARSMGGGGGPSISVQTHVDARGADAGAIARIEHGLAIRDAELEARITQVVRTGPALRRF